MPGPDPDRDLTEHASHDQTLTAALAAGDLVGPELAQARARIQDCPACRRLHEDLLAIATATRQLPPPVRPPARDFRISVERAARLGPGSIWRRLLRPFGPSGSGAIRPLATAFTTLGLAGLLFAALPSLQLGGGTAAAPSAGSAVETPRDAASGQTSAPESQPDAAAAPTRTSGDTAGGEGTVDTSGGFGPAIPTSDDKGAVPTAGPDTQGRENDEAGEGEMDLYATSDQAGRASPLVIASLGLLGAGLALFLLRRAALRLR
jgi:hypothetical protein